LTANDRRKIEREVMATRGDLLFSCALILFEGETEEQALPIYAEAYWGATAHEKGYSFVGCGGANYFAFVWLAQHFNMRWYVFCDGEQNTITGVNNQLQRAGLSTVDKLPNASVIDGKLNYEEHLIASGYMDAIEKTFEETLGQGSLDKYITELDGKPGKKIDGKETTRDYKGAEGRKRAALDLLLYWKTRLAAPVAATIVALPDAGRRVPPAIKKLFNKMSEDMKED
jgi:putative ATP-dependent endonuclease of OLD family